MNTKKLSALILFVALALPQSVHALPHFHSAKWADRREVDSAEIGTRTPLILIHGIQSDESMWNNFLVYYDSTPALKDNFKPYIFQYYTQTSLITPNDDPTSIEGLGTSLGNYFQQWKTVPTRSPFFGFNDKQIVVMAHSMGGLVARSMMQNYHFGDGALGRTKISLLITLATPHHGTPAASDFYVTPDFYQHAATFFFDLHPNFGFDMAWDCSDGRKFGWFCGTPIESSSDYSKIVAYGGVTPLDDIPFGDLALYGLPWVVVHDHGYDNDGVVPIESALFAGTSVRNRRVVGSCDHSQIYLGTKSVEGGVAIFNSISDDLETAIPPTPARPLLWDVSPNVLTGLPLPEKQRIRLIGSGFSASCTLTFNDGVNAPYTGRAPIFVSGSELNYDIAVGTSAANWTVKVVKGTQESDLRTFTVVSPLPPATGAVTISLSPPEAISAGAQWQVDGGSFRNSGDVATGLTPGVHVIAFHSAFGFVTPGGRNVTIAGGALTSDIQLYADTPPTSFNLSLNGDGHGYISPSYIGTGIGSTYPSGATVRLTADASYGYHFVGWSGDLSGSENPADVTMTRDKSVTANFAPGDPTLGTLVVTIQPPEAAAAGVTWGWNDNDVRSSGSSVLTSPGSFLLVVHLKEGWWGSGYYPVTVVAGQTTNVVVTVSSTTGITIGSDPRTYFTLAGLAGSAGSMDAAESAARFNQPAGLAVDRGGNLFVADYYNHTIRKITPTGTVSTFAGLAGTEGSEDGVASSARFSYPSGVAVDNANNVYVADLRNHTIRKITPDGAVSTLAGLAKNNGSDDGIGAAARFNQPAGVAVDTGGNVYVADLFNNTIRKITPDGTVSTLAGLARSHGITDGLGGAARFFLPNAVAVDVSGTVYVADTENQTIRKIDPTGMVSTLAGFPGSGGASDGTGNAARFLYPTGVALDQHGNVYVADNNNNSIRKVTVIGIVTTLAGSSGQIGSLDGIGSAVRFKRPTGVAVDGEAEVFVTDSENHTIRTTRSPNTKVVLTQLGGQVVLSWPTSSFGFMIEASTTLAAPNWTTVFPLPSIFGSENRVTNTITGSAKFYRLRR